MTSGRVGPFDQTKLFRSRPHAELAAIARRLRHARIVPGFRGDPDALRLVVFTVDRATALDGVERLGLGPRRDDATRTFRGGSVVASVHGERALVGAGVSFSLSGNEPGSAWSFGELDVQLAEQVESALAAAPWVAGYREPHNSVNPATYPWFFEG